MTQDPYSSTSPIDAPVYPVDEHVLLVEDTVIIEPAPGSSSSSDPGKTDVAKEQAQQLGQGAGDAGKHVAGVAKEQAAEVAGEAKAQARDVLSQARSEVHDQADNQKQRVTQGLHSISRELDSMVDGSDEQGVASDLARQASQIVRDTASWLDDRDPGTLLEELRSFARRRPGAFLGIALTAGVVAGRLTRGLKDAGDETAGSTPSTGTAPSTAGAAHATSGDVYATTDPYAATDPYAGGLR